MHASIVLSCALAFLSLITTPSVRGVPMNLRAEAPLRYRTMQLRRFHHRAPYHRSRVVPNIVKCNFQLHEDSVLATNEAIQAVDFESAKNVLVIHHSKATKQSIAAVNAMIERVRDNKGNAIPITISFVVAPYNGMPKNQEFIELTEQVKAAEIRYDSHFEPKLKLIDILQMEEETDALRTVRSFLGETNEIDNFGFKQLLKHKAAFENICKQAKGMLCIASELASGMLQIAADSVGYDYDELQAAFRSKDAFPTAIKPFYDVRKNKYRLITAETRHEMVKTYVKLIKDLHEKYDIPFEQGRRSDGQVLTDTFNFKNENGLVKIWAEAVKSHLQATDPTLTEKEMEKLGGEYMRTLSKLSESVFAGELAGAQLDWLAAMKIAAQVMAGDQAAEDIVGFADAINSEGGLNGLYENGWRVLSVSDGEVDDAFLIQGFQSTDSSPTSFASVMQVSSGRSVEEVVDGKKVKYTERGVDQSLVSILQENTDDKKAQSVMQFMSWMGIQHGFEDPDATNAGKVILSAKEVRFA